MTILPFSNDKDLHLRSLENLWQNYKTACDMDNASDAINILNESVKEIEENILTTILLKRANAFIDESMVQEGIEDLQKVVTLSPTAVDGYFHLGNVLQTLDKRAEALRIYRKGIKAVDITISPPNSPKWKVYQSLVLSKKLLEEEIEKTNTILLKLPLELLDTIFIDLVTVEDRYQAMWTCRAWKKMILENLPTVRKRHVMVSNMSKPEMTRLFKSISQSNDIIGPLVPVPEQQSQPQQRRQLVKISILPRTSNRSLQTALIFLMQKEWSDRVWCLDILSGMDHTSLFTKESLRMLQVRNQNSVRSLTLCSYKNTSATVDAIEKCPKLQHLISAAHHALLDDMPQHTFSGKKLGRGDGTWETEIEYGRDMVLANARKMQFKTMLSADDPSKAAEQYLRQEYAQRLQNNFPTKVNHKLKKLELIAMEMSYFLTPLFWRKIPLLEHVTIKNPVGLSSDFMKILQNLHQHCPNLKTIRYGEGWDCNAISKDNMSTHTVATPEPSSEIETDVSTAETTTILPERAESDSTERQQEQLRQEQDQKQQVKKNNLVELIVRTPHGSTISIGDETSLINEVITANCNTLRTLVLQMELLNHHNSSIDKLVDIAFPCLKELQFHSRNDELQQDYITGLHMSSLAANFPVLEKIVFNGIGMTTAGLLGFRHMGQRLRCIHLKLSLASRIVSDNVETINRHLNINQIRNNNDNDNDDHDNNNNNDIGIENDSNSNISDASSDDQFDDFIINRGAISLMIRDSMSTTSEACFSGHQIKVQDILTLTTCNYDHLTTLRLVSCKSITDDTILVSALSHANYLRHITFANMSKLKAATIVTLTVELVGYLEELAVIECSSIPSTHYIAIPQQVIDRHQQESVVVPGRKIPSSLKLYFVPNLSKQKTHIIEYYTLEQQQLSELQWMTPRISTKLDISIVKPILHFL